MATRSEKKGASKGATKSARPAPVASKSIPPKAEARKSAPPNPKSVPPKSAPPKAAAKSTARTSSAPPPQDESAPSTKSPALKPALPPKLTVRTPAGADELKQKIGALATATQQIRNLKRTLSKSFFEVGQILRDIEVRKLYEVKGYGSFESFLEREIDLGKQVGLRLARAVEVFQREAAVEAGFERVVAAVAVLDGEGDATQHGSPTTPGGVRSPIPFHKL